MRGRAHGAGWEVSPCPGQPSSWWVSELTGPGLCARSREGLSSRSISQGMLSGPAPCRQCPAAAWALSPWHRQVTGAVGRVVALEVPVLGQPGGRIRAQGSLGVQPGCAAVAVWGWLFGVGVLTRAVAARVVLEEHWAGHARGFPERWGQGRSAAPSRGFLSGSGGAEPHAPRHSELLAGCGTQRGHVPA